MNHFIWPHNRVRASVIFSLRNISLLFQNCMNLFFIICQSISFGKRASILDTQSNFRKLFCCIHSFTTLAVWHAAPSCWIMYSFYIIFNISMDGNKLSLRISMYLTAFTVSSTMCNFPTPYAYMQPQIITEA